ncbi:unnamed protein product [Arabidopsis halleri]
MFRGKIVFSSDQTVCVDVVYEDEYGSRFRTSLQQH